MNLPKTLEALDPVFTRWYKGIVTGGIIVTLVFLVRDTYSGDDTNRILLDFITLIADIIAYYLGVVRKKYVAGVIVISSLGIITLTSTVILAEGSASPFMVYYHIIGLASGLLFRGVLRWFIGVGSLLALIFVFSIDFFYPEMIGDSNLSLLDYVMNHLAMYFLIVYGTWLMKNYLNKQKDQLKEQNLKIAAQNKALSEQQDEIKKLNQELQIQLDERTQQLAKALKDSSDREAYMRSLVESQTTFLFRIDMSGKILFINKALAQLIQGQTKGVNGSNGFFKEKLMEKDRFFLEEIVFEALDKPGSPVKATLPLKKKLPEGETGHRYIDWEFLAVKNMSNGKMEIQAVGYDITHRLQFERQIKEKSSELELTTQNLIRRNKELTDFGYMVSHNLRGPVANIVGLTDMLNKANGDAEVIDRLKIASGRLDGIIRDLNLIIDLKNTSKEDYESIDLEEVSNQVVFQLENKIKDYSANIILDFPQDLHLFLIKPYLFSIIYNLVSNGLKYHHPNRAPIVWVIGEELADSYVLKVKDNGHGIDLQKHRSRLFNLYERFSEAHEGKGIGLHMVKVQVEAMHGHIEVESQLDKGTCFTITFPKTAS